MNKLNKLFAILFAVLGVGTLSATDYITGASGFTVNKIVVSNDATNGVAREFWSSNENFSFDIYQDIEVPDGVYTFQLQSMYRAHLTKNSITNVALYANTSGNQYIGRVLNYTEGSVSAENLGSFNTAFSNDANNYLAKIPYFIVTDGKVKVGVRTLSKTPFCNNGHWFIYNPSSFKLSDVTDSEILTFALNDVKHQAEGLLGNGDNSEAKTNLQNVYNGAEATSSSIVALKEAVDAYLSYLSINGTKENPNDVSYYFVNPKFDGSTLRTVGAVNVYNNGGQPFGWVCYEEAGTGTANQGNALADNMGFNHFTVVDNTVAYDGQTPGYSEATTGNSLYNRFAWAQWSHSTFSTKQSVILPSGSYKLSVPAFVSENGTNYDGQIIFTINGNASTQPLVAQTWKVYETDFILTEQSEVSVDLQFRKVLASANAGKAYAYFDGITLLCYGDPIAALLAEISTKKSELETYNGTIPTALYSSFSEHLSAAGNANNTQTEDELQGILDNLNTDITAAKETVTLYVSLKALITQCKTYVAEDYSIVKTDDVRTTFSSAITKAETDVEEKTTADDVNAVYATLEAARRAYIVAAIPTAGNSFDMTFLMTNPQVTSASGWTNGGTATNQQYTGAPDNTYLDFYQVTRDMYQTLSDLPNGSYSIKAATRGHASVSVGYIYVKNGDNKITQDIHKVGSSGNDLGNGWGWTTTNSVSVVDGQLTIGFYGECGSGQWVGADNFTLYRTFDVTGVQVGLTDLKSEAQAIATASEPMDAAVEAALNSTIQATDATVTDPVTLDNMIDALNTAIANAEASIADYVRLQKYIDMTAAFADVTAYQAKYDNGQYSSEDVETVRRELNVTRFNAASAVFTNNIEVTGWAGTMGDKTTSGQHWDGTTDGDEATKYYDNNSWNGTAHSTTTSIKLPAGSYVLKAALRSNENTTLKLTVLDNVVDVEGKGDKGYGIDTNGQANFSAEGTYANDNIGRGWEWEFVKFQLAEETEVTLTVECDYNGVYGWASFSDITLWMDDATYVTVYGKELDAPLAEAKALVNTKPMGTAENTALADAIALGEATISTPAELNAAVDALKSAVANANAWLAAYNEAKAPLVAALERFETDYNDAENGALDHMNKSRWATAIEKAQAAAVAKDATDSYAGFADATAALVDALDAATVSVNEYASLKSAITEATAVRESEVNWGDAPFQRPESAQEGLNTAISAAESGYDAAEADGEEVTALIDAMAVTLNVPQDAYCITVATDGHAYVGCPVVASLGSITDNNPTGYGLAAKKENEDLLAQLYTFTQVEGNKYRISVTVDGVTVYLTYGVLNDSQAGYRNWQIQGNTDIAKAGEFEVVASTTTEGVFRLRNTVTGTFLDCQDGGAIYTDDNIAKDEFALTSATGSAAINISADAKLGTCVLMFDAQLPDGLTAYVPESYDDETTVLTLKMVTGGVLPAYTPCLLYAEGGYEGTLTGTVTMNGYADKVTGDDGLLYGAIESQTITEGYILQKHDGEEVAKFYSVDGLEEEIPISAGKCWLTLANGVEEALETPAAVAFFFRGGGATKLNAVVMDKTSLDGAIYTLDGKRVNTMQRGEIYIINGQKVMVK